MAANLAVPRGVSVPSSPETAPLPVSASVNIPAAAEPGTAPIPLVGQVSAAAGWAAPDFISKIIAAMADFDGAPKLPPDPANPEFRRSEVLKLRMTQMSAGMREVADKREMLKAMKSGEAEEFIKKHEIPAVIGPDGHLYIIDHHHLVRAAWEAGITDVHVKIRADFSKLSAHEFWNKMAEAKWVYPYDQFGNGPYDPSRLPEDVRGLANDPYRDVAWQVRERGGYEKSDHPFAEFLWANFFRAQLKIYPVFKDFEAAVVDALQAAKSDLAKKLPGYKGKK